MSNNFIKATCRFLFTLFITLPSKLLNYSVYLFYHCFFIKYGNWCQKIILNVSYEVYFSVKKFIYFWFNYRLERIEELGNADSRLLDALLWLLAETSRILDNILRILTSPTRYHLVILIYVYHTLCFIPKLIFTLYCSIKHIIRLIKYIRTNSITDFVFTWSHSYECKSHNRFILISKGWIMDMSDLHAFSSLYRVLKYLRLLYDRNWLHIFLILSFVTNCFILYYQCVLYLKSILGLFVLRTFIDTYRWSLYLNGVPTLKLMSQVGIAAGIVESFAIYTGGQIDFKVFKPFLWQVLKLRIFFEKGTLWNFNPTKTEEMLYHAHRLIGEQNLKKIYKEYWALKFVDNFEKQGSPILIWEDVQGKTVKHIGFIYSERFYITQTTYISFNVVPERSIYLRLEGMESDRCLTSLLDLQSNTFNPRVEFYKSVNDILSHCKYVQKDHIVCFNTGMFTNHTMAELIKNIKTPSISSTFNEKELLEVQEFIEFFNIKDIRAEIIFPSLHCMRLISMGVGVQHLTPIYNPGKKELIEFISDHHQL